MNCYETRDLINQCWAFDRAQWELFDLAHIVTSRGRGTMSEAAERVLGELDEKIIAEGVERSLVETWTHPLGKMSQMVGQTVDQLVKLYSSHTDICKRCKNLVYFLELYFDVSEDVDIGDMEKTFWGDEEGEEITCKQYEKNLSKCISLLFTDEKACHNSLVRKLYFHRLNCFDCTQLTILKIGAENEKYRE